MRSLNPSLAQSPFGDTSGLLFARRNRVKNEFDSDVERPGSDLWQYILSLRVTELEGQLAEAVKAIDSLRNQRTSQSFPKSGDVRSEDRDASRLIAVIGRIQEISQRLFPGPVSIDYAYDPEDRTHEYIVFDVVAAGEFVDYRDKYFEWHREVEAVAPNLSGEFRLIVHPHP